MVTLYGSKNCGKCNIIKKKLKDARIAYDFVCDEEEINDILPNGWGIPVLDDGENLMNFADSCKWIKENA